MAAKRATKKPAIKKPAAKKPAAKKPAIPKRAAAGETLSIAGLSAKARTAIAKAARKRRQSVDAWAAEALEDAAQRTLAGGGDDAVLAELKKLSRKFDQFGRRRLPRPLLAAGLEPGVLYDDASEFDDALDQG